ncbi:MAG: IclR family transcriptional regulator [Pseudomonadota bacterium]|nr:IclR family transcriptional regulator [Pseudomonadota bacterium]
MPAASVLDPDEEKEGAPSGLLHRTLAVLELLSVHARGLQLSEVADRLRIPRSASHRVLNELIERGYVKQDRRLGAYQLTAKVASLAFTFLSGVGVTDLAQPILDRLAAETGELVRLSMVDGQKLIWVAKSQGAQFGLRYDPELGQEARLSCSASGIAWLSCLSDAEALALVAKQGFGPRADYGPKAPQTAEALLKYLRAARKRGFAMVTQTYSNWMATIAAPIRDAATQEVTGTVNIAGPYLRLTEARMLELAPMMLEAARELSIALVASPFARPRGGPSSDIML